MSLWTHPTSGLLLVAGPDQLGSGLLAASIWCCCPRTGCTCPSCVIVTWDIVDDGSDICGAVTTNGEEKFRIDSTIGGCFYRMDTNVGSVDLIEVTLECGGLLGDRSSVSITAGTCTYFNSTDFTMPDVLTFPYDSGTIDIYRPGGGSIVGTVRVRTTNDCTGAIE